MMALINNYLTIMFLQLKKLYKTLVIDLLYKTFFKTYLIKIVVLNIS